MKKTLFLTCLIMTSYDPASAQDNACLGSTTIDSCVVGTWQLESGGPVAWMQGLCGMIMDATQNKVEGRVAAFSRMVIRYHPDGTYETGSGDFRMSIDKSNSGAGDRNPGVGLQGDIQPATGRWSVSGATLNSCQDSGGMSGMMILPHSDHRPTTNVPGGGDITMEYECSGSALKTSMSMGFFTGEERYIICNLAFGLPGEEVDAHGNILRAPGDDFPMVMEFVKLD